MAAKDAEDAFVGYPLAPFGRDCCEGRASTTGMPTGREAPSSATAADFHPICHACGALRQRDWQQ